MPEKRDYYESLELARDASPEDVKKAFRKFALQYHPDRNKEPGASDKFKEVSEAYQVLSDPERRTAYDRFGHAATNGEAGRGFDGFEGFGGLGDIFDAFFGGSSRGPRRGRDLEYELEIAFLESATGVQKTMNIERMEVCDRCDGLRAEPGTQQTACVTCGGAGQVRRVQRTVFGQFQQVATCSSCGGLGRTIKTPCTQCRARGAVQRRRQISVDIPAGIEQGSRIKMRGQGEPGGPDAPPGDLYVHINVAEHPQFHRDGDDLCITADVNIAEAALGAEIGVPALEGHETLKVRPGVQSGEEMRIRGKGFPSLQGGRRGDQVVTVRVVTPGDLSSEQKQLLEALLGTFDNGKAPKGRPDVKSRLFGRR
jgi:molecular chaperone DnaJ